MAERMDNFSLFDDTTEIGQESKPKWTQTLDVVKMEFAGAEALSWQDLFSGFDSLHAITFSSSVDFVCKLLGLFDQAEIIFGCQDVMSFSLQEIMAYQCKTVECLRDTASEQKLDLISRMENDTLRFYVAKSALSHEKIYLLSAADGRKRVIMGSANMSRAAFGGYQRENICYVDGEQAYEWYWDCYCRLREDSTDQIAQDALLCADISENLDKLPIAQTVRVKKAIVLQPTNDVKDEVRFMLDVKNLASKFGCSVPSPDKSGKLLLSPEKIKIIKRQIAVEKKKEQELRSEYPQLQVFPGQQRACLNGINLELNPSEEDIKKDISLFIYYMNGYEALHGDIADLQRQYYKFANWLFCSPFMAYMRDVAVAYDYDLLPYPVFGLLLGLSKAGKTKLLETLLIMMIGQKVKLPADNFTRTNINSLKRSAVKGVPIIVDDLRNDRFGQHAGEMIKNDDFGTAEHILDYPAVAITSNDIRVVSPDMTRRMVICHAGASVTNSEAQQIGPVRTVRRNIGTAFYREYLRRMLDIVPELAEEMKNDESESAPDILAVSSDVLLEIFETFADQELPLYIQKLRLNDYFGEKTTGEYSIKIISDAWEISPGAFKVLESKNQLHYNAGDFHEASRIIKGLPETLTARQSREWVLMDLAEAKDFFGIQFEDPENYAVRTIKTAWETNPDAFKILKQTNRLQYRAEIAVDAARVLAGLPEAVGISRFDDSVLMNLSEANDFFGVSFKKSWLDQLRKKKS